MNKLSRPPYDDGEAICALAKNTRVLSHPHLQASVKYILQNYKQYVSAEGNAFLVFPVKLSTDVAGFLKKHYSAPPKDLQYISEMRRESRYLGAPCVALC